MVLTLLYGWHDDCTSCINGTSRCEWPSPSAALCLPQEPGACGNDDSPPSSVVTAVPFLPQPLIVPNKGALIRESGPTCPHVAHGGWRSYRSAATPLVLFETAPEAGGRSTTRRSAAHTFASGPATGGPQPGRRSGRARLSSTTTQRREAGGRARPQARLGERSPRGRRLWWWHTRSAPHEGHSSW